MQNDKEKIDSLKNTLKFIKQCPVCGAAYKTQAAKIFGRNEANCFVHMTCEKCRSHFMAMVVFFNKGMSTVGMITDLSCADAERLFTSEPISLDEILDHHLIIKEEKFHEKLIK